MYIYNYITYIYIYIYISKHINIYIYIYIERERDLSMKILGRRSPSVSARVNRRRVVGWKQSTTLIVLCVIAISSSSNYSV